MGGLFSLCKSSIIVHKDFDVAMPKAVFFLTMSLNHRMIR